MRRSLQRTPFAGACLAGMLLGISFPPSSLGSLAWIAMVPLLLRLESELDWRTVVIESLCAATLTTLIVGYWVLFHPIPSARAASLAGLLVLAITFSIPYCIFGIANRHPLLIRSGLLLASASLIEYAQFHSEIGFPWLALGQTQAAVNPVNQLAAYFGVPGLSTWVLSLNLLSTALIVADGRRRRRGLFVGVIVILLCGFGLGYVRLAAEHNVRDHHRVLAIQPASTPEAWADVQDRSRPADLIDLTWETFNGSAELVIWPETTLPVLEARDSPSTEYLSLAAFVDSLGVPLLTGAVIKQRSKTTGEAVYYNSAILLSPRVGITARFDKRIPVPFAERVPYIDDYPWLERFAVASGGVSGYAKGERPRSMTYDDAMIGIIICFESVFGRASRAVVSEDLAYFVVLAQDGWWGDTAGYRQHYALTRLRAIETGRSVVQVTVTGITGLILPDGSTHDETKWMERTGRTMEVPAYSGSTFYVQIGDLPILIFNLTILLSGFVVCLRVRKTTAAT